MIKKYFTLFSVLIIIVAILIAYANTLNSPLQFDDGAHIRDSERIRDISNYQTLSYWKEVNSRPLSQYTLALNYQVSQMDTTSYHWFNMIIHMLAGLIVFFLTRELLTLPYFREKIKKEYIAYMAFFTALIFVLHPIQTQAVTYIVQRMTSMAAMFYLFSVLLYVKGRRYQVEQHNIKKAIPLYLLGFVSGYLGLLSKQPAITFPFAWLLVELFFIRDKKGRPQTRYLIIASGLMILMVSAAIIKIGLPRETPLIPRDAYLITQFRMFVVYMQLMIVPFNQNIDHFIIWSIDLWHTKELLSLLFTLLIIGLGVYTYKKNRLISFGIFWYFLTSSVESGIIPIRDAMFEHRLYLPFYGFSLIVVYLVFKYIAPKKLKYALTTLSVLAIIYLALTVNRNNVWRSEKSLWMDSVKKAPKKERNWHWLASAYLMEDDKENAMKCYNTAIKNNPYFDMAFNARANLKKDMNDLAGALKDYNISIRINPKYAKAYFNRGVLQAARKKYDKAIADYDMSEKFGYRHSSVYYNRANSKRIMKKYEEATADYNKSIRINPKYALAYYNRGLTTAGMKKHKEAIKDIDRAIQLDPKNHLFYNGRGVSEISLNEYDKAVQDFTKSIKLKPNFGQAYYNRGWARYFGLKQQKQACNDWNNAIKYGYRQAEPLLRNNCKN